jgi:hypothetical protein
MRCRCTISTRKAIDKAWSGNIQVSHESGSSEVSPLKKISPAFWDMKRPILEHYQENKKSVWLLSVRLASG